MQLKEVDECKWWIGRGGCGTKPLLRGAKAVVGPDKNRKHGLKILQFPGKASASAGQCGDIMAQISIDTSDRKGVIPVVDIKCLPGKTTSRYLAYPSVQYRSASGAASTMR